MEDKDEELVRLKLAIMSAPPLPLPLPPTPPPVLSSSSSLLYFLAHQPPPSTMLLRRQFFPPHPAPPLSLSLRHPSSILVPASAAARQRRPAAGPSRRCRSRRSPSKVHLLLRGKSLVVDPPPYPWATTERAKVKSIGDLLSDGIRTIKGDVKCKRCDSQYQIEYDLVEKFYAVDAFFGMNEESMHNRAPPIWMSPTLPNCRFCKESICVKPIVGEKRGINWLFLFLGQMLGCCKLTQLKYFCKHNDHHSTGAKDRVVYFTYKALYKQLQGAKQPA